MGLHLSGSSVTQLSSAFAALPKVAGTVSASGAAVLNKHNPVDATGATRSISLPTGQAEGTQVSVEKVDTSANLVSVTGSIRGVGSSTLSLAWQFESIMFRTDSAGSWWPIAGHKTKSSIDAAIDAKIATSGQSVLDWWANGNAWPTRPTVSSGSYHWVGPASAGQPPSGASGDLVDLVQGL